MIVIFGKNALPRVEAERRILVWALVAFVGFWLIATAIGVQFAGHTVASRG